MLSNKNANVIFFSKCCSFFSPVLTLVFRKALSSLLHSLSFLLLKYLHCDESWGTAKLWPSATTGFIHLTQLYLSCLTVLQGGGPRLWLLGKITCFNLHCTLIPKKRSWSSVQTWLNERFMSFVQWWYFLRRYSALPPVKNGMCAFESSSCWLQ